MATRRDPSGSSGAAAESIGNQIELLLLLYPKQRLRWTAELHEQFVKAVAELGGANKAKPKSISKLMGVEGITLFHIKSHLQKFRLGKIGRKLRRKGSIPLDYNRKGDDILPPNEAAASTSGSKPAEAAKPALLSLFPTWEWPEYLHASGSGRKDNSHHSCTIFESFSDQVATSDNAPPHIIILNKL
ncbi:myb-related protein 2-like [Salvia divinorum]|uniref:Myb-related protein 2-like n=1 Tax=Salvia divinorum TaxID=28513 RepID=A0ABD1HVP1_SALDI